jgi:hypothetical protein
VAHLCVVCKGGWPKGGWGGWPRLLPFILLWRVPRPSFAWAGIFLGSSCLHRGKDFRAFAMPRRPLRFDFHHPRFSAHIMTKAAPLPVLRPLDQEVMTYTADISTPPQPKISSSSNPQYLKVITTHRASVPRGTLHRGDNKRWFTAGPPRLSRDDFPAAPLNASHQSNDAAHPRWWWPHS